MLPILPACLLSHFSFRWPRTKHPDALSDVFVCPPTFALKKPIIIVLQADREGVREGSRRDGGGRDRIKVARNYDCGEKTEAMVL